MAVEIEYRCTAMNVDLSRVDRCDLTGGHVVTSNSVDSGSTASTAGVVVATIAIIVVTRITI